MKICVIRGKKETMAISFNRLTEKQYEENFSDIHPPFENKEAALVEANRCIFVMMLRVQKVARQESMFQNLLNR